MDVILWVLTYAPVFLILISLVITVHELGHYWVGRMFGAAVESFSLGFGRSIFEVRDKRGTRWRLNWIPLGGFVKFVGEVQLPQDVNQEIPATVSSEKVAAAMAKTPAAATAKHTTMVDDDLILVGKPYTQLGPWKRIAVSLGGPFANFVFAVLAFGTIGLALGVAQAKDVYITSVTAGGAAEKAGIKTGDIVLSAGGRVVTTAQDIQMVTQLSAGEPVTYKVLRGAEQLTLTATPIEEEVVDPALKTKQKVGRIGLGLAERDSSVRRLNPVEAFNYGVSRTGETIGQTFNVLRRLVTGKEGIDKLSGPVGILHLTGGAIRLTTSHASVPQTFVARVQAIMMGVLFKSVIRKALLQDLHDIKARVERT